MQATSPLANDYYLTNFCEMLTTVERHYRALLPAAEWRLIQHFTRLEKPAQMLLVRLLARKGQYFRLSSLNYPEIPSIKDATDQLHDRGFINVRGCVDIAQGLSLFNKKEWLQKVEQQLLVLDHQTPGALPRVYLDELITTAAKDKNPEQLAEVYQEQFITIAVQSTFDAIKLLYFGNVHQDLSEFVLRDLALQRYEPYALNESVKLFTSWDQVSAYLRLQCWSDKLSSAKQLELSDLVAMANELPTYELTGSNDPVNRRWRQMTLALARELERREQWQMASCLYQKVRQHPARERLARILAQRKRPSEALAVCKQILDSPWCEDELEFAQSFGHRTAAKRPLEYWPKPKTYQPPTETWSVAHPGTDHPWGARHPERAVACALGATDEQPAGDVYYVENQLFLAVFALVYWPAIFAPVAGAFSHPFQSKPHDLYWPEFVDKRAAIIANIDQWMAGFCHSATSGSGAEADSARLPAGEILARFDAKHGIACSLIHWPGLSTDLLGHALARIPALHWRSIFDYLWRDLANHRKGLPDLIYFPADAGYELIEVKGPGDKLQNHQRRWLQFFNRKNIPHKVVSVVWQN